VLGQDALAVFGLARVPVLAVERPAPPAAEEDGELDSIEFRVTSQDTEAELQAAEFEN